MTTSTPNRRTTKDSGKRKRRQMVMDRLLNGVEKEVKRRARGLKGQGGEKAMGEKADQSDLDAAFTEKVEKLEAQEEVFEASEPPLNVESDLNVHPVSVEEEKHPDSTNANASKTLTEPNSPTVFPYEYSSPEFLCLVERRLAYYTEVERKRKEDRWLASQTYIDFHRQKSASTKPTTELSSSSVLKEHHNDENKPPSLASPTRTSPRKRQPLVSKYFPTTKMTLRSAKSKSSTTTTSPPPFPSIQPRVPTGAAAAPTPPLSSPTFGLIQESLSAEPFFLLLATVFLNKTSSVAALPRFFVLKELFPTPEKLAQVDLEWLRSFMKPLGLWNVRAERVKALSEGWIKEPPIVERKCRKAGYPPGVKKGRKRGGKREVVSRHFQGNADRIGAKDDRTEKKGAVQEPTENEGDAEEVGEEEDDPYSYEIAHLPGVGAYALDSWRIFCRDNLLGREDCEWRSVRPKDKELRAYLKWRWKKEGVDWEGGEGHEGL